MNPLFARMTIRKHATGLHSAELDCDHGLDNRTRVYYSRGHLSEASARRSGIRLANAIGRSVMAVAVAVAVMLPGARTGASSPPKAPVAPAWVRVDIDGHSWRCASVQDCAALMADLGCKAERQTPRGAPKLVCDSYRKQLLRHSA